MTILKCALTSLLATFVCTSISAQTTKLPSYNVNFQRDVQPVLTNICSACHGPDARVRKAGLRLDTEEGARRTIVAHFPDKSSLYLRMKLTGPGQMPPADFLKRPTAKQIETIGQWIKEGAKWERHWAYKSIAKPTPPNVASAKPVSEIDRFILSRMAAEKMAAAGPADKRTLARRLSFDLTGLPPTFEQVSAFIQDRSPNAYEKYVDALLSSPHFGERMAVYWLDLVRYADTRGYHGDQNQEISPYRDYVINAFNSNMPFDRFTREQLAGDLLTNPTQDQKIASGYNKLLMTTEEGGSQAKEYMAKYAADRVRNLSAVWMGSTMGCCQCHDHKYDPFTMRDFYGMAAFFADVKQTAVGALDITSFPTPEESKVIGSLNTRIAALTQKMNTSTPELMQEQNLWEAANRDKLKEPASIAAIFKVDPDKRTEKQKNDLSAYFRSISPSLAGVRAELAGLRGELDVVQSKVRKSMITTTTAPYEMRVLPRGNWLDDSGEIVSSAVPAFLEPLNVNNRRATRLDLANWLTDRSNPLTSRVMVNRIWALMFGKGLCKSVEDFGLMGAPPTYPELMDWLASSYIESGWDTKKLIKTIVMTEAYKRSSVPTLSASNRDPGNELFGRQGRKRLDAEFLRDNALAVSGLLVETVNGVSVKPYQPSHYWDYLNFPMRTWQADNGDNLYRRGVYTYWCRTYLQPSLLAFDAPTREECTSARVVSNTPQQALTLLNDPTYVEAAKALAEKIARLSGISDEARIIELYKRALQRVPTKLESTTLMQVLNKHRAQLSNDNKASTELLNVGAKKVDTKNPSEIAAWTSVARVVLNLHESITRN